MRAGLPSPHRKQARLVDAPLSRKPGPTEPTAMASARLALLLLHAAAGAAAMDSHPPAAPSGDQPRLKLQLSEEAPNMNITVERWLEVRSALVADKAERGPALMARKEVREMTCTEWDAYVRAVRELYESDYWTKYRKVHENERQLIWDLSHSDARQELFTFLPWHRLWLRGIERELQKIDPTVAIPYWNWALDSADPLGSAVLSDKYALLPHSPHSPALPLSPLSRSPHSPHSPALSPHSVRELS